MAENFKLPGSSYEELVKIIKAYSTAKNGQAMSLDMIAQTAGMDKTVVSRNNAFLVQTEIISDGNKKAPTELGNNLGRAYTLKMESEVAKIWVGIILKNEFLTRMLSAIRIRNGMEKSSFVNHILYSSGSNTNNNTRAGANTIIEILKYANLIIEQDGKISACEIQDDGVEETCRESVDNSPNIDYVSVIESKQMQSSGLNITININIDVKENELDTLSDKIKKLVEGLR